MPTDHSDDLTEAIAETVEPLKPSLRGWLHAGTFPLALLAGLALILLTPNRSARTAVTIFTVASSSLFGVSALYHRLRWRPRIRALLRRLDHSNIFLMIAATYTPFGILLLRGVDRAVLLTAAWSGAVLGVLFRVFWVDAPRWFYTPIYLALGWVAIFWLPDFYRLGGTAVVTLLAAGGLLYSLGALVYGLRRPNPSPRWFGFHEVFHACTVAAFAFHYIAISLISFNSPDLTH